MPELEVQLFGALQVTHHGQPVTTLHSPRQQALLAWLLLHPGVPQPRKHIAFAIWPDSDEGQALTNLRRELHHLRRGLPDAGLYLEVTPGTLRWRHDAPYRLDVTQFEQAAGHMWDTRDVPPYADLERAMGLYQGDLLYAVEDSWLEPLRQALHQRAVEILEQLVVWLEQAGGQARALRYAEQLVTLEPLRESAYAGLMRLQLGAGDHAAARHTYDRCASVLKVELGALPGEVVRAVYRQLQEQADDRPPATRGEWPLIGRRSEWQRLLHVWREVRSGTSRVLLIRGEAGIGKTRLAEALLTLADTEGARTARTRSYAAEGRLAYEPIRDWLRCPALRAHLPLLGPPWQVELVRLLPELSPHQDLPGPEPLSEGWQRQRFFEALARTFLTVDAPLLLLLDDLQWCDRDTLEWLHFLLRFAPRAPLLLVCTLRREEQDANPALPAFLRDFQQRGLLDCIDLGALSLAETGALAAAVLAGDLPPQVQTQLFKATEGQPLFIVEAVRAGLAASNQESAVAFPPSPRVQAIIAARLDQLSAGARSVAQLAATIGRAFDVEVLRGASDLAEEPLTAALDELWQRAIIREQPGSSESYDFTHDRLREGAYDELSPARCRLLHRRVAQALELRHAVDPGGVAAQLAAHHERAGQDETAVHFSLLAAERANSVSASQQAIHQATQVLRLLERFPAGEHRDHSELTAHNSMAAALTALKGFTPPELERTLNRALQLAEKLGDETAIIRSLWGLYALHIVRGNIRLARTLAEQALQLAGEDTGLLTDSHQALGGVDLTEGHLAAASGHFAVTNRLYYQHRHRRVLFGADVGVFSLAWGAHGLWLQGKVEEAREQVALAAAIAAELGHPFTQMQASAYRSISHQLEGDLDACRASAEMTVAGCERYDIAYYHEWGVIVGGWSLAQQGGVAEGLACIKLGLETLQRQDAALRLPYYLALLAETQLLLGQPEAARAALDGAQSVARQNNDLWYLPELYRMRGLLNPAQAEPSFHRALALAREQGSLSLELRAATSLAARLQGEGRSIEAEALLEPVQAAFPAALVTHDLNLARALLQTLP
ncbi:ATP-binding protein [Deinococcus apachensis]|uniref:ATP-binding protein n=1 Tax=Deinococcus apachensis TaxID=309886 RepID=UPI00035DE90F|nr:AAA family ATPase [Deinococcus apachensis]